MPGLTFDDLVEANPAPARSAGALTFDDLVTESKPQPTYGDYAKDVARGIVNGVDRGVAGLAALPVDAARFLVYGADQLEAYRTGKPYAQVRDTRDATALLPSTVLDTYGAANTHDTSFARMDPTTGAGKVADTVASFVPGALVTGGLASAGRAAATVAAPAAGTLAAQGANSVLGIEGLPAAALEGAGALAGGGLGAFATRAGQAERAVAQAAGNLSPQVYRDAQALMDDAARMGVRLTADEAIQQVTGNGTRLGDLRRVVENSRGGGEVLRPMMAERPGQVQATGRAVIDDLAPQALEPSQTGQRIQAAAQGRIDDARAVADVAPKFDAPLKVPATLAERPDVAKALKRAADDAANEGKPLPTVLYDEAGKVVPNGAAEAFSAGSRGRLDGALGELLGTNGALAQADDIVARRAAEAGPKYAEARAAFIPSEAMPTDLLRRLKRSGALSQAQQKMAIDGQPFDIGRVTAWDYMKRALDDRIGAAKRSGANDDVRIFTGLKNDITSAIDEAVPAYAEARAAFAGHSELLDALQEGGKIFGTGQTREAVRKAYNALSPGEQEMFRLGAGNAIRERLANAGDSANLPHVVAGNAALRDKLSAIADPDKLAKFNAAVANEGRTFIEATAFTPQSWYRAYKSMPEGSLAAPDVRQALDQVPGVASALRQSEQLNRYVVDPLERGAIGALAQSADPRRQAQALLPNVPNANSQAEVARAIKQVAQRDLPATQNLIRGHIRSAFDEATQDLASGANQFAGSKFASIIAGNGQQAANLEAAVRALPNGDQRWQGFRRFLDVMEATGKRPQTGSATAFNQEIQRELKQGRIVGEAATAVKTGGLSLVKRFTEFQEQLNAGRNSAQIANLLTRPDAARILGQLADTPPNAARAQILALRLSYMGRQGGSREE